MTWTEAELEELNKIFARRTTVPQPPKPQLKPLTDEQLHLLLLTAWAKSKTAPRTQP